MGSGGSEGRFLLSLSQTPGRPNGLHKLSLNKFLESGKQSEKLDLPNNTHQQNALVIWEMK